MKKLAVATLFDYNLKTIDFGKNIDIISLNNFIRDYNAFYEEIKINMYSLDKGTIKYIYKDELIQFIYDVDTKEDLPTYLNLGLWYKIFVNILDVCDENLEYVIFDETDINEY